MTDFILENLLLFHCLNLGQSEFLKLSSVTEVKNTNKQTNKQNAGGSRIYFWACKTNRALVQGLIMRNFRLDYGFSVHLILRGI